MGTNRQVPRPTAADLLAAADVVGQALAPTPVVVAPDLGDRVVLKLETLQPTGSFKVRGGLAAVARAAADGVAVVTASAGNHGLGVAYAAARFGVDATIVVPEHASTKKVQALERFAITLVQQGATYDDAEAHALALARDSQMRFVSPYNDPHTIAGQSTIVGEVLAQVPDVSSVVVPVGGGGLLAGVALGIAASGRNARVDGVVAAASPAMVHAYETGRVEPVDIEPTLADGLAGNLEPGTVTLDIAREHVAAMAAVTEDEIASAVRYLAFEHGIVAEGSGAVGVAALRAGRIDRAPGATVVLVTGRNIAPAELSAILAG